VPEGTQPGTVFRIKGQGIPSLRGSGKGDLFVQINVEIPKRLSEKQKEILRQFDSATTGKEYEQKKSFIERMKDAFN
jgi:molecular chaperone DnaJ